MNKQDWMFRLITFVVFMVFGLLYFDVLNLMYRRDWTAKCIDGHSGWCYISFINEKGNQKSNNDRIDQKCLDQLRESVCK